MTTADTTVDTFHCADCGQDKPRKHDGGTGYAIVNDTLGLLVCYDCVAIRDKATMIEKGHSRNLPLYLSGTTQEVTNWPGTLRFPLFATKRSQTCFGGTRTDVWFTGPDGKTWHGRNQGDMDIVHCKRTKG